MRFLHHRCFWGGMGWMEGEMNSISHVMTMLNWLDFGIIDSG